MKRKVLLLGGNGLVGRSIAASLNGGYQIIPTAGHHDPENGYRLTAEEPDRLVELLAREDPEIVVSSLLGDYEAQMSFHKALAEWVAEKKKRLLYISSANVFDGDLSKPWTESDPPVPASDFGCFKRDCEAMLGALLGSRLTVLRLAAVWSPDCPRVQRLTQHSRSGEPYHTYPSYTINITFTEQIGRYAKYVLDHDLHGIFHIGTTDMVNYSSFEKMVCEALKIKLPRFVTETAPEGAAFAILPSRKEIPDDLQMTVSDVLSAWDQRI